MSKSDSIDLEERFMNSNIHSNSQSVRGNLACSTGAKGFLVALVVKLENSGYQVLRYEEIN